jgi:glycosidase
MCWDDSEFGGFSTVDPWIKPHSMVKELNLKNDLASDKSVFRFYQQLLKARASHDALTLGSVEFISKDEDNCFITLREYEGQKVVIVCNFEETQDIQTSFQTGELLLSNYNGREAMNGEYKPFEIAVYKL